MFGLYLELFLDVCIASRIVLLELKTRTCFLELLIGEEFCF